MGRQMPKAESCSDSEEKPSVASAYFYLRAKWLVRIERRLGLEEVEEVKTRTSPRSKGKAAEEREKLDATVTGAAPIEAPPAEDPFADSFPVFASGFGIKIDKAAATPHLNGVRSISLELLAALGPMSIFVLLSMMLENIDRLPARVAPIPRAAPTAPDTPSCWKAPR
jgi:hypothetical protein